ncbi:MAG: hypothetical protein MJA82_14480 [Clostridia bacterium]|nr:hypothetical protein [Clostridia bacterium]
MNITFNEFVDNGLYVASYHLGKDIHEITLEDLEKNIELFSDKVYSFIECGRYKKIANMGFQNSCYTQGPNKGLIERYGKKAKLENIKSKFRLLFRNLGDEECCSICGKYNIKITGTDKEYIGMISRSLMPNLTSNTFFNCSNNLQFLDVCPICLFLSMISILNIRKSGNLLIYNSEDKEFMRHLTIYRQKENKQEIAIKAQEENNGNTIDLEEEIIHFLDCQIWTNKDIYIYIVNNSGQNQVYEDYIITEKNIKLFKKLIKNNYIDEFSNLNLFRFLLADTLKYKYLTYLIDLENEELRCSVDLFELIDRDISLLSKEIIRIIRDICYEIYSIGHENRIQELKLISSFSSLERLINKYVNSCKTLKDKNLIIKEKSQKLLNDKNWRSIKNRMIAHFIILKEVKNV